MSSMLSSIVQIVSNWQLNELYVTHVYQRRNHLRPATAGLRRVRKAFVKAAHAVRAQSLKASEDERGQGKR